MIVREESARVCTGLRVLVPVLLLAAVLLFTSLPAYAFIAVGGFDEFDVLRFRNWRLVDFDTNQDGDVTEGEGLEYLIFVGPNGFTDDEVQEIFAAAERWANVPTSFAQFRNTGLIQDPLETSPDIPDLINVVSTIPAGGDVDAAGLGSVTATTFSVDETFFGFNGIGVNVTAGTVLDADILINIAALRDDFGVARFVTLEGLMVPAFGLALGLGQVPTNNVSEEDSGLLVETPLFVLRDENNVRQTIGVTPSMFFDAFFVRQPNGTLVLGNTDLAPDDIAGVSFLYPRENQGNFFSVEQRARTQTRPGLPSLPLPAALITAWVDHDNSPLTNRIPLYGTITGLYEDADFNPLMAGNFAMYNMYKRIEVPGEPGQVDATYTFTINPLNGQSYSRQQPPGYVLGLSDVADDTASALLDENFVTGSAALSGLNEFISAGFPSETFNEFGNVFDISNFDVGTPIRFDESRDAAVSVDTGRTLEDILERRFPMFGDPNDICPLSVVTDGTGTGTGGDGGGTDGGGDTDGDGFTKRDTGDEAPMLFARAGGGGGGLAPQLRQWRDQRLMQSRAGSAIVDSYYSMSPALARLVSESPVAYRATRGVVWLVEHVALRPALALAGLVMLCGAGGVRLVRGRRMRRALAGASLVLALGLLLPVARADILLPLTTEELLEAADAVVVGEVTTVESRVREFPEGERIVTDITVLLDESVKGNVNKQSTITFTQRGGRVGDIVTYVPAFARFDEGERVLLYLKERDRVGFVVVGGRQGKLPVGTDKATGEQYVYANTRYSEYELRKAAQAMGRPKQAGDERPTAILLEDYIDHLRGLLAAQ